jgi:hypothetical protein
VEVKTWNAIRLLRQNYDMTRNKWLLAIRDVDEVIKASESLMNAESSAIWTSTNAALQNHRNRLSELLSQAERYELLAHSSEASAIRKSECDLLRLAIASLNDDDE